MAGMQLPHRSPLVQCVLLESMNYLGRACREAAGAGRGKTKPPLFLYDLKKMSQ